MIHKLLIIATTAIAVALLVVQGVQNGSSIERSGRKRFYDWLECGRFQIKIIDNLIEHNGHKLNADTTF
jgi:hypothetical protein